MTQNDRLRYPRDKHFRVLHLNIQSNVPNPRVFLLSPRDWLLMSRTDFKEQFIKTPALLYTGTSWQQ